MRKTPKKIAYILSQYPVLSQTFVAREIEAIRRLDIEISIYSLKRTLHNEEGVYYPNIIRMIFANLICLMRTPLLYIQIMAKILFECRSLRLILIIKNIYIFLESVYFSDIVRKGGATHIHAHFLWGAGTSAWIISQFCGIPFSITVHAFDIFDRRVRDYLLRIKLYSALFIVTISEFNKRFLQDKYGVPPEKINVIHCGIDNRIPQEVNTRRSGKRECLIVSVGRLTAKKGFNYLLEALNILKEKGISVRAEIIGDGEDGDILKARSIELGLDGKVSFRGALHNREVIATLTRADIFVLPCIITETGDMDGIPVVLMEAMTLGIPVVSTAISGIPELIEDGVSGLLVNEKDSPALAESIYRLITDREKRNMLAKNAILKIRSGFTIEDSANQLAVLFNNDSTTITA